MADEQQKEKPARAKRRWWARLCLWALGIGAPLLVLAAAGVFWAYSNRTSLANDILRDTFAAFDAQIGQLDVGTETIVIRDVTVRDPKSGATIATVRSLVWQPEWAKMAQGNLGRFRLEGASLDATAEQLRSWAAANKPDSSEPAPPGAGWALPGLVLERSELRDVSVRVRGDAGAPGLQLRLDHTVEGLDLTDPRNPKLRNAALRLDDLVITQADGKAIRLAHLETSLTLRESDRMIVVGRTRLRGADAEITPWLLRWLGAGENTAVDDKPPALGPRERPWFDGVLVPDFGIEDADLAIEGGDYLPLSGRVHLEHSAREVEWRMGAPPRLGHHKIELASAELRPARGQGAIAIPRASIIASGDLRRLALQELSLPGAKVEWTQALEDALVSKSVSPKPRSDLPEIAITKASISDLSLMVEKTAMNPVAGRLSVTASLEDLVIKGAAASSARPQTLALKDVSLSFPVAGKPAEPILELAEGSVTITPDVWTQRKLVDSLSLAKPLVRVNEKTLPWMKSAAPGAAPPGNAPPAAAAIANTAPALTPWWEQADFGKIEIKEGRVEVTTSGADRIEASTDFDLSSERSAAAGGPPLHRLTLSNVKGTLPDVAKLPVAGLEKIEIAARLPELWKENKIETFKVKGGRLEIGEGLMAYLSKSQAAAAQAPPPAPLEGKPAVPPAKPAAPGWQVGELDVGSVGVTLYKLAPGIPPVHFDVSLSTRNTPLNADGIARSTEKQRVEISSVVIPSPYDPLRTVAEMDTIFLEFTLEGLAAQRIDKVEVVSPTIFVGEDLFWYIDYCRKFAAAGASGERGPKIAATSPEIAFGAANAAMNSAKPKGWDIQKLQVHAGKLVLAPKGIPLPGFRQPFPFSFETALDDGQFEATLDIPPDTYTLEDLKLEFRGTRGHVKFNLPIKGRDNNLTEVFKVDQIRWKNLHTEDAFLTVTYDMNGIYAQLGSAAYDGYVNGAFNIYLDSSFSWDGWLAATGVKTTEITQKLCPAYFLLDGKVDGKLIAFGSSKDLHQADLEFKNVTPGVFSIHALNDLVAGYKTDRTLKSQILGAGLETLRDFRYNAVDGQARFHGREGKGHLKFKGPTGSRNIEVNVLDHRWKEDKKPQADDETLATQP